MSHRQKISELGEFGWLKKLIPRLYWPSSLDPQLCIGPGDDAGALCISPGKTLVATTDTLVERVHFERRWFSPRDLGEKLMAVNLSDLAAMGQVKPLAALVTVALPGDTSVDFVDKFYRGLKGAAERWKVGFLGGDTVGSARDIVLSATLLGEADRAALVQRSGARKGDLLAVCGPLGLAAAGLEIIKQHKPKAPWMNPLLNAFFRPQPQFAPASALAANHWATSLIDSSDGLEASARLLAENSKLGVEIDLDSLPVTPALKRWAANQDRDPAEYVLRGGEDYALVFTVQDTHWPEVKRALPGARTIGRMVAAQQGSWAIGARKKIQLNSYGYAHFKK